MADPLTALVIGSGALVGAGGWLLVGGVLAKTPSLSSALTGLVPRRPTERDQLAVNVPLIQAGDGRIERAAVDLVQRLHLPLSMSTLRLLGLQGRSVGELYAGKLMMGLAGWAMPTIIALVARVVGLSIGMAPLIGSAGLAVLGFMWPDIELRKSAKANHVASETALAIFFDLVTLERLANASATQAVATAAALPRGPLFDRIRNVLEQARLQQRAPWQDLRRLGTDSALPELCDLADILQLDEQGASLADSLQSRVRDLRNAQLSRDRIAAQERAEGMTVWMVLPVMIFALLFLCPPLLRLMGGM